MVHSISAISPYRKIDRDSDHSSGSDLKRESSDHPFMQVLKAEIEQQKDTSRNCQTTIYGNDSKLHTFLYQTREYHY